MKDGIRKALRISLLTETFPPEVNGVSFTLAHLARGLCEQGSQVEVLRPARDSIGKEDEPWSEVDLPARPIPNYPQLRFGLPCSKLLRARWEAQRPDVIYLATEGPAGFSALRVAGKMEIPVVSGFHTNFDLYLKHYKISFLKPLIDSYLRWFHNRTLATFAPTDWMIEELESKGYRNLRMLSRGVNRELFSPSRRSESLRKRWGAGELDRVLLCVSRVAAEKNLDLACKLFDQMIEQGKATAGIIVGDGPEREKLTRKYPRLLFPGCLNKISLAEHYASADLFVFPSTTETFGNVVTEALTSGLPVIAYDYAAPSEYIEHGKNGFLSSLGDQDSLNENLNLALGMSGINQAIMSRKARESTKRADWNKIVAKFHRDLVEASMERPYCSNYQITPAECVRAPA
jgi:glycosyltransferase involved in cell wall biosynthesis